MPRKPARKPRRRSRRRPRRLRLRTGLALALILLVGALAGVLYLHVTVARLFDGRLWKLPSRIYSNVLVAEPGDRLDVAQLVHRLERSGYARTAGAPGRPGQYRRNGAVLDVYLRPFQAASFEVPSRSLRLSFHGGRLRTIADVAGQDQTLALFEPELLATLYGPRQEERSVVPLEEVPEGLVDAVRAAEDARFFKHHGLDLRGILRAAWTNVRHGRIVQGGSTITQQTVKNLYLGQERTWWRKGREVLMALILDARYEKERILEVYLNEVYLGQRGAVAICGFQAAARFYFGRDLLDLSLGEQALLAGMIRSPGTYNPFVHPDRARGRRDQVLDAMRRLGVITEEQEQRASGESLALASGRGGFSGAGYLVDFIRSRLAEIYSPDILLEEGLRVYTTVDTVWQENAEAALLAGLERLERDAAIVRKQRSEKDLQGAVIVTQPSTGALLAMVGGRDYAKSQFNRAVQARRQPGSCFKPFIFAAGLERGVQGRKDGFTVATLLEDSPFEMVSGGEVWRPENYDETYRGQVTVRQALQQSLNVPTVRAAQLAGIEEVIEAAHRCGIDSSLSAVPSVALGAEEVSPLELAEAYATLADLGRRTEPWIIRQVTDKDGNSLQRSAIERERAISPQTAYLINDMLGGVLETGTGRSAAKLGFDGVAAGKTGTTDDTRDAWFVGYTPNLLALVWVGYDDSGRTGLTGASGALPVWVDLMRRGGSSSRTAPFPEPPGIVRRRVDPTTGRLAVAGCPEATEEIFAAGTEPGKNCPLHRKGFRNWLERLGGG